MKYVTSSKVVKDNNCYNNYCVHEALVRAKSALMHQASVGKYRSSPGLVL